MVYDDQFCINTAGYEKEHKECRKLHQVIVLQT